LNSLFFVKDLTERLGTIEVGFLSFI